MRGCHSPGAGRITAPGVELAAIDAHRAAEAAGDIERRLGDGVARQAWRNRLEIHDFAGRAAADHSVPPRSVSRVCGVSSIWEKTARPGRYLARQNANLARPLRDVDRTERQPDQAFLPAGRQRPRNQGRRSGVSRHPGTGAHDRRVRGTRSASAELLASYPHLTAEMIRLAAAHGWTPSRYREVPDRRMPQCRPGHRRRAVRP